jgi:hypothetical protein
LNYILFLFLFYFILFGGVLVMVVQADDTRPAQASKTNLHALN